MTMTEYNQTLTLLRKIYDYLPDQKAIGDVTILSIFNKSFNEDAISDYLAYILNPNVNGIGILPLKKLILATNSQWLDNFDERTDEISVTREFTLNNGRRIDLLIEIDDQLIIGIEHKVYSHEHGNQTLVYAEEIKSQFPDQQHVFIFLTPDKREAIANEEFQAIGYEDLVNLLKQVNFDYLHNIKKSVLFEDFIAHLEEHFMSENKYSLSEKTKLYMEHYNIIDDLQKSFEQDYHMVLNKIMSYLKNSLENHLGKDDEWIINSNPERSYQQISKDKWNSKGLDIHFELALSKNRFASAAPVEFMIDIEGKKKVKDSFVNHMEERYSSNIANIVKENKLHKNIRSRTFISKEYSLFTKNDLTNQSELTKKLELFINNFLPFVNMIDDAIIRFPKG